MGLIRNYPRPTATIKKYSRFARLKFEFEFNICLMVDVEDRKNGLKSENFDSFVNFNQLEINS